MVGVEEEDRNVGKKREIALHTFEALLLIMTKKKLLFPEGSY